MSPLTKERRTKPVPSVPSVAFRSSWGNPLFFFFFLPFFFFFLFSSPQVLISRRCLKKGRWDSSALFIKTLSSCIGMHFRSGFGFGKSSAGALDFLFLQFGGFGTRRLGRLSEVPPLPSHICFLVCIPIPRYTIGLLDTDCFVVCEQGGLGLFHHGLLAAGTVRRWACVCVRERETISAK